MDARDGESSVRFESDPHAADALPPAVQRVTRFAQARVEETSDGAVDLVFPNGTRQQLGDCSKLLRELEREPGLPESITFTWATLGPLIAVPYVLARDIEREAPPLSYRAEELAWDLVSGDAIEIQGVSRTGGSAAFPAAGSSSWRYSGHLKLMPVMRKRLLGSLDSVARVRHSLHQKTGPAAPHTAPGHE
jgi:hypothetical protein